MLFKRRKKVSHDEQSFICRAISVLPRFFCDPEKIKADVFQEERDRIISRLYSLYPNATEIKENEILRYRDVLAVRVFSGIDRGSDYYVHGYEAYVRKSQNGKKWYTYDGKNARGKPVSKTFIGKDGAIPEMEIWFCGMCGDVNCLRQTDYVETMYFSINN